MTTETTMFWEQREQQVHLSQGREWKGLVGLEGQESKEWWGHLPGLPPLWCWSAGASRSHSFARLPGSCRTNRPPKQTLVCDPTVRPLVLSKQTSIIVSEIFLNYFLVKNKIIETNSKMFSVTEHSLHNQNYKKVLHYLELLPKQNISKNESG